MCSISSLSHCKTKYQYLNDLEVALSSSTQKQLLRAITRMAKKWSIQHLRSSCCPGLWCHLDLLLFFGGVQPWSEISLENGWWIIISPLKMASLDGIPHFWTEAMINEYARKNQHQLNLRNGKAWKTGNHMAPGKSRSRWILFQPEVRGGVAMRKKVIFATPVGFIWDGEDMWRPLWLLPFATQDHNRVQGNSKFSDGQRAIQQHNYSQDIAVKRLLYDTLWYCMILNSEYKVIQYYTSNIKDDLHWFTMWIWTHGIENVLAFGWCENHNFAKVLGGNNSKYIKYNAWIKARVHTRSISPSPYYLDPQIVTQPECCIRIRQVAVHSPSNS